MSYRIETDSMGEKQVPAQAYYGVQTVRATENFKITGYSIHPELIRALAGIKKAAALVNRDIGLLDERIADAIMTACDEIMEGKFNGQFITDPIQGGAGTSINMNANEVIANRAIELLSGEKGDYSMVHPYDHVNMGQSTNDVIPSAGKITTIRLLEKSIHALEQLHKAMQDKAKSLDDVIKMGRTQLQDAVPIRLGQEFKAYAGVIRRDIVRIQRTTEDMRCLNLGATAIGTGINADAAYERKIVPTLCKVTGMQLTQADDLIDATQNIDGFVAVSSALKTCAVSLSKIANDLRLLSSGPRTGFGEINLPPRQHGSSIMPGKVNPVIPEVMNQVSFSIIGYDLIITMAVEAGQLELNAFQPVILFHLFQSIEMLTHGVETFTQNCISGITANRAYCKQLVNNSIGIITAVCPHIGYKNAANIAKAAITLGEPARKLILQQGLLDEAALDTILEPYGMTEPGIPGKALLTTRQGKYKRK